MANELNFAYAKTGVTVTAKLYFNGAQVGSTINCTEISSSGGCYTGNMPSVSAGVYQVYFYDTGTLKGSGQIVWNGTSEVTVASILDDSRIDAIKAKTDALTITGGLVSAIVDKTGYTLTLGERVAIATQVEAALLNDTDGQQLIDAIVTSIGNSNVNQIALVAAIRADIERTGGALKAIPTTTLLSANYVEPDNAAIASIVSKLPADDQAIAGAGVLNSVFTSVKNAIALILTR